MLKKLTLYFVSGILYFIFSNSAFIAVAQETPLLDLVVTAISAPASFSTQEQLTISWRVTNQGNSEALPLWNDILYLSTDTLLDASDIALIATLRTDPLASGASYTSTNTIFIPALPSGNYYLLVITDYWNTIYESNETNNILSRPITIKVPDLVVTSMQSPPSASTQQRIEVSWTVQNQGDGNANINLNPDYVDWRDALYLSTDAQWDASDIMLRDTAKFGEMAPTASYIETHQIVIPSLPSGNYYLIAGADWIDEWRRRANWLYESDENNNLLAKPITIKVPDIAVVSINAPDSASTQQFIEVSWTVENQGDTDAAPALPWFDGMWTRWDMWRDSLYLSTDTQLDGSDTLLLVGYFRYEPLAAGERYSAHPVSPLALIPNVPSGVYYLLVKTDYDNHLYESNKDNNILYRPITIRVPDLVVTSINAPAQANTQETITVSWTVANQGNGKTTAEPQLYWFRWLDFLYLSTDEQLDDSDIHLNSLSAPTLLASGASYTSTNTVTIPMVSTGNYYLLVVTDAWNGIYESKEWNNVFSWVITIGKEGGLSEGFSQESNLTEELLSQKADTLTEVTVTGDLTGTANFPDFEIVTINSGSFKDKGFFKGNWQVTLDGISYQGNWQGVSYLVPSERKFYLKGTLSGGEAKGIIEGFLTESSPASNVYDQYQATWKLSYLGGETISAALSLQGTLSYQQSISYPLTQIHLLQTSFQGTTLGHYNEAVDIVLTHLGISDTSNPYQGQGFSIISYTSQTGSGEGWTYDRVTTSGKVDLKGLFTSPLLGIVYGRLDETTTPKALSLSIERIDLGLPPQADLKVKVWGPTRVSPGQTIDYIIEYRNDGLKTAEDAIVTTELPIFSEYISASEGAFYNELAETVIWDLGMLPAKTNGFLSVQVTFPWGLPEGLSFDVPAYITLIESHSTEDNLSLNGFELKTTQTSPGVDNPDVKKYKSLAKIFDAKWYPVYTDMDFFEATPHAFAAMLGIPTDKNGLSENQGPRPKVLTYSGSTISGISMIEKDLVITDELHVASLVLTSQERLQQLSEKGVDKIVVYYSPKDDLIKEPYRMSYSPTLGVTFKDISRGIEEEPNFIIKAYLDKKFAPKIENMRKEWERIASKYYEKTLQVKFFKIFPDLKGNQVELEMQDDQGNIFPLTLPDGTPLPKTFYIQNDLKTGQPIKTDGIVKVEEVGYASHSSWPDYLITKLSLQKIGQEISDTWQDIVSFFKILITTARDPNQKLVSPEGDVSPRQRLTYKVEYENEGEGIAFGVYFTDTLNESLDDSTLDIGSVIDVQTGSQIAPSGTYNPNTRTITWFVGEVGPGQGGFANFSVNVRQDAMDSSEVINFATVYFPSVPEATRTNGTVNRVTTYIDNIPPTTTATLTPLPNQAGWNNTNIDITLSGVDNEAGSGVAKTEYSLDSINWTTYTTPFNITNEGTTTVYYKSTDNAGNTEQAKSLELKLDKTPPTIADQALPQPNSFGWNNTDVTVTFTASDSLSGVKSVTEPIIVTTEGANQYIGGEAIDFADNRVTTYVIINLDKTPPDITLTLNPIKLSDDDEDDNEEDDDGNWYELIYSGRDSLSGLNYFKAGLVILLLDGYQIESEQDKDLEIRIDAKKKELEIESPNPEEILTQLHNSLLFINSGQILQPKLKQGEPKWKIKEKSQGLEIQVPSIAFKAEAGDYADNIATKELEFQREKNK